MLYVCLKIIVNGDMRVQATSLCCSKHERIRRKLFEEGSVSFINLTIFNSNIARYL